MEPFPSSAGSGKAIEDAIPVNVVVSQGGSSRSVLADPSASPALDLTELAKP